jgi:hypothetical protein
MVVVFTKLADKAEGTLIVNKDWVYFLALKEVKKEGSDGNNFMDTANGAFIYRVKKDGSMLCEVANICSIEFVIDEGKIYFTESKPLTMTDLLPKPKVDINMNIGMINTDGTEKRDLGIKTSSTICIKDGWLYYSNKIDKGIYKSRLMNQKVETDKVLSMSADEIAISGNTLLFTQSKTSKGLWGIYLNSRLYKTDLDGKNLKRITLDCYKTSTEANRTADGVNSTFSSTFSGRSILKTLSSYGIFRRGYHVKCLRNSGK